ncbi:hypothetical protein CHUAL_005391 [Chamberlinius hualienensis]
MDFCAIDSNTVVLLRENNDIDKHSSVSICAPLMSRLSRESSGKTIKTSPQSSEGTLDRFTSRSRSDRSSLVS